MEFAAKLLAWFDQYGRHDLPWQKNPTPYRVWISEIMLQQTQVTTVIPYYQRFMQRFPSLKSLATAELDDVLSHWSGLGYYARARNIHKSAQIIRDQFSGRFPTTLEDITQLPGIGQSTAGAILSFAMQQTATILDGNVKRVLCRFYAINSWPGKTDTLKQLWQLAEKLTPKRRCNDYNQAIMDLGATLCTRSKPKCALCPFTADCQAHQLQRETDFPIKKPTKKKRRLEKSIMLIIEDTGGKLLLTKRPPIGIWGGLWCFPMLDNDEHLKPWLQQACFKLIKKEKLAPLTHQFSHFQLDIQPILIKVKQTTNRVMETSQVWYTLNSKLPGGIPKPVTTLLKSLPLQV